MPELLILVGIPGSGKSTFAKELVKTNNKYVRVNRDDMRQMLKGQKGQGFVEYALILAVIVLIIVGAAKLVGTSASQKMSDVAGDITKDGPATTK